MTIEFSKLHPLVEATIGYQTGQPHPKVVAPADKEPIGVEPIPSHFADKPVETVINAFTQRKTVLVLSPFMAEDPSKVKEMERYARRCVQDSLNRREAPVSMNLFFYSTLNFKVSIDHDIGLQSMLSWVKTADLIAVYIDFGVTQAMQLAVNVAQMKSRKIEYRSITEQA